MARILIVAESRTARQRLRNLLDDREGIEIIGFAETAEETVRVIGRHRPDLAVLSEELLGTDCYDATRMIMRDCPVPVVIVSKAEGDERALRAGAVAALAWPRGLRESRGFARAVRAMSEVRVVRRRARRGRESGRMPDRSPEIVAIGCSTGGPPALQILLAKIDGDFPLPIVIVQHITNGFLDGLVKWLQASTLLKIRVPEQHEPVEPGSVYFAPCGRHMGIADGGRVLLVDSEPLHSVRPSVSHLFRSVSATYGPRSIGVLLSGMGRDGAEELRLLKDLGAATIVQDRESANVYGMAGEAVRLGGVERTLPPGGIARFLNMTTLNRSLRPGNA